jgi:hypothetical protein
MAWDAIVSLLSAFTNGAVSSDQEYVVAKCSWQLLIVMKWFCVKGDGAAAQIYRHAACTDTEAV